jgi:hypothetical protein
MFRYGEEGHEDHVRLVRDAARSITDALGGKA